MWDLSAVPSMSFKNTPLKKQGKQKEKKTEKVMKTNAFISEDCKRKIIIIALPPLPYSPHIISSALP